MDEDEDDAECRWHSLRRFACVNLNLRTLISGSGKVRVCVENKTATRQHLAAHKMR